MSEYFIIICCLHSAVTSFSVISRANAVSRFCGLLILAAALAALACGSSTQPAVVPDTTTGHDEERVLKVAMTFLDEPPDPYRAGWLAVPTGLAETLFRLGDDLNPEPWLAAKAEQVNPTTWEITLRRITSP